MAIAVLAALVVTVSLFAGYMLLRKRHAEQVKAETPPETVKPAPSPVIQVFVDDAMLKGSETLLGGTLLNISPDNLTDLSVELELKRRKDGTSEVRTVSVAPKDLTPEQQGRYALQVFSRDYSGARFLRIKSGSQSTEVPFKTVPGAQRPPERIPQKTVIVNRPSPRPKDGGFINTPDNPTKVP
jgi:hypothetical protein